MGEEQTDCIFIGNECVCLGVCTNCPHETVSSSVRVDMQLQLQQQQQQIRYLRDKLTVMEAPVKLIEYKGVEITSAPGGYDKQGIFLQVRPDS